MNDVKQSFKELVKSCMLEMKQEKQRKEQLRATLKKYVRGVLKEVIAGPISPKQDKDEEEKINKGFDKNQNMPKEETQDSQVQELASVVHAINKDYNVYRETEGVTGAYDSGKRSFIIIDAGELHTIRIKERWENNFDIEEIIREQDRVIALGLSWPQVKAFVKANVTEVNKTTVQSAHAKSDKNAEDQIPARDTDLPDTTKGIKVKKISDEPQKDGDETAEDDVEKKEDEPSAPMKQVVKKPGDDPKSMNKAKDQEKTPQVKPPKHKNDDELVKRMPGKKKDKGDEK